MSIDSQQPSVQPETEMLVEAVLSASQASLATNHRLELG